METLGKLFGGINKVKVMRLFLLNPELVLSATEVGERTQIKREQVGKELSLLAVIGLLVEKKKGPKKYWQLDASFPFLLALKSILKNDLIGRKKRLISQFSGCGKIGLIVIAGVFLEDQDSRADLLLVGTQLKRGRIAHVIKELEAEIGKELAYAILETEDFRYRLNACDKFVRDILDYPHGVILDKIGLNEMAMGQPLRV